MAWGVSADMIMRSVGVRDNSPQILVAVFDRVLCCMTYLDQPES
jgi:hypothetical protein